MQEQASPGFHSPWLESTVLLTPSDGDAGPQSAYDSLPAMTPSAEPGEEHLTA